MAIRVAAKVKTKKKTQAKPAGRVIETQRVGRKAAVKDLEKFRARLMQERERLEIELQEIENRTARISEGERANELSAYEDHPADLASETFEREKDLAIGESVEGMLNQVLIALEKVDRGTYGVCDVCSKPIKKARLNALPFATLCLECQARIER
jgi:RNA polymerase-binding transcription factor DksA